MIRQCHKLKANGDSVNYVHSRALVRAGRFEVHLYLYRRLTVVRSHKTTVVYKI